MIEELGESYGCHCQVVLASIYVRQNRRMVGELSLVGSMGISTM